VRNPILTFLFAHNHSLLWQLIIFHVFHDFHPYSHDLHHLH
jgi:hypothetical protein